MLEYLHWCAVWLFILTNVSADQTVSHLLGYPSFVCIGHAIFMPRNTSFAYLSFFRPFVLSSFRPFVLSFQFFSRSTPEPTRRTSTRTSYPSARITSLGITATIYHSKPYPCRRMAGDHTVALFVAESVPPFTRDTRL